MWDWMHLGAWWWLGVGLMILFWVSVIWSLVYLGRHWSDGSVRSTLDERFVKGEIDEVEYRGSRELIEH